VSVRWTLLDSQAPLLHGGTDLGFDLAVADNGDAQSGDVVLGWTFFNTLVKGFIESRFAGGSVRMTMSSHSDVVDRSSCSASKVIETRSI
jgi:hypothetical protein